MDQKNTVSNKNFIQFNSKPTVTCVIAGGRRRLNYTFQDKSELVEEYDMKTHELLMRKYKKAFDFKESPWVYEVGETPQNQNEDLLVASLNPIFLRRDTQQHFQFRIRNLIYPEDVYQIEVDDEKQEIVIKTTIKKYYKRFNIPDMRRMNLTLDKSKIKWVYKNNTLLISYPKPDPILQKEQEIRNEFDKLNKRSPKEGDIECVHQ